LASTGTAKVVWHTEAVMNKTNLVLQRNMERAALFIVGAVVRSISTGQPVRRTRGGWIRGLNPSRPGQPPHVLLGKLRQSITHRVVAMGNGFAALVGSGMVYARRLELGFAGRDSLGRNYNQAPRPYLRPAVRNNRTMIGRIIAES
jgi:hypothetical protein